MDMSLSRLQEMMKDREAWHASVYGLAKSQTQPSDWTIASELKLYYEDNFISKYSAFAFILQGFNEYASAYFTGLGNGRVSAAIAFMRTFALQSVAIFCLPILLGVDGLWFTQTFAEVISTLVAILFLIKFRHEYMG